METNTKRNEHPRCGCTQCKRGAGSTFGQLVHSQTNRKIRRKTKQALKNTDFEDFDPVVISTPYTD